jgi:DNA repair photolyase
MFYANTYELLCRELPRKRRKPTLVYFSTACEPFVPHARILDVLYRVVALLLEHSVFVLFSTKSRIPQDFLELLAEYPEQVHVQVGLTTVNDFVRSSLEPRAPAVRQRLGTLRRLAEHGIRTDVRMDPLIPELTDNREAFSSLFAEVDRCGIRHAVASYLFLRRANYPRLNIEIDGWSFAEMAQRVYTHRIDKYCGGGSIRVPALEYRRKKYDELKSIATEYGISLSLCRCKNPDVTTECCHPQPSASSTMEQTTLF